MANYRFQLTRSASGFDLEKVKLEQLPVAGPGQVLIRVHAVSMNRRDMMIRELTYPVGDANHFTPLSDAAGEVVAIGSGVTKFTVGDRVCSTFFQNWPDGRISLPAMFSALGSGGPGVLADHIVLSENGIAPIPEGWSFEEGASYACAGVTAWNALKLGQIQKGDWALVIGTGGVAIFALQIAVAAGAKVVILSSSEAKLERARALGATVAINYNERPDWDVAVKEATQGGVQHAVELGGVGTLQKSISSMAIGGHVALVGGLAGFGGEISAVPLIMAGLRMSAVLVGSHADHLDLTRFMAEHGVRPVIDSVFDVDSVEEAYKRANAGAFGKVVIRLI